MFRRVLVANRGEIAARIVRSCRRLGVETVVVHSQADAGAPWLEPADESWCIGPARAADSYLDHEAVIQAAEQSDCQAVHPGYGFLSENALFAARCAQHGLTFIGPSPAAIRSMGDKATAKRTMQALGVPTIPGSDGVVRSCEEAREIAARIGYPILLKATAGGGGKGMRRCDDEPGLPKAWDEATREAGAAFADDGLYLERLIEGGRHIEFQVLADAYGRAVHLGERECSVQRQHQKLFEEAPSPAIDQTTRERLGATVAAAVARIGYRNAGTVEFLRAADGALYFMEMNTRLQVEHPVTEMLTGVDLVEQQLRIAAGQPLGLADEPIRFDGHAIELRINAEDPDRGFRPDPGTIERLVPPSLAADAVGLTLRWESAIREGYRIPPHYDSMIGKLVVHGPTREATIDGALGALDRMRIEGVATTIELHRRLLAEPRLRSGAYDVDLLTTAGLLGRDG